VRTDFIEFPGHLGFGAPLFKAKLSGYNYHLTVVEFFLETPLINIHENDAE
jgi:hypothetical protein